jgi:hypothetical protein
MAEACERAEHQAWKLGTMLWSSVLQGSTEEIMNRISEVIPTIAIEQIEGLPLSGMSFWGRKKADHANQRWSWFIHVRAGDSEEVQLQTVLCELKHIIDYPLRREHPQLFSGYEWEELAEYFADEVMAGACAPAETGANGAPAYA